MRAAVWALLVASSLLFALSFANWDHRSAYAQKPANPAGLAAGSVKSAQSGDLMAFSGDAADGRTQLVLIDAKTRAVGVYHIDRATGQVALRSVRNVHWDLQIDDFNGGSPSPQEIKSLLPTR